MSTGSWLGWVQKVLIVGCLGLSSPLLAQWQTDQYITQSFMRIALSSEYGQVVPMVRKWQSELRVYVEHLHGDGVMQDSLVSAHLRHLQQVTGLAIRRVESARQANVTVHFATEQVLAGVMRQQRNNQLIGLLSGNMCLAHWRASSSGAMQQAQVYIAVDQALRHGGLVTCIVEELTQILGLPQDDSRVTPSIFSDHSGHVLLTGLDETLLRLLYSSDIHSGMSVGEVNQVLPRVIARLRHQGIIDAANFTAGRSELAQLLSRF